MGSAVGKPNINPNLFFMTLSHSIYLISITATKVRNKMISSQNLKVSEMINLARHSTKVLINFFYLGLTGNFSWRKNDMPWTMTILFFGVPF